MTALRRAVVRLFVPYKPRHARPELPAFDADMTQPINIKDLR